MQVELTGAEMALLPYLTNELYQKYHSVIATHFPIKDIVGKRLIDNGLLTSEEYVEMSNLPVNEAGSRLICSLNRKGDDSMETFYKVLVSARGERGVDFILQHLEAAAVRSRKESGYDSLPGLQESPPPVKRIPDVDLAILELQEQVKQLSNAVARLQRVIEERPYQMIQALPAQATGVLGSHTDSCASNLSYMTALSMPSRNNSARSDCSDDYGSLDCGPQISDNEMPVQAASTNSSYKRRHSLPAMPLHASSQLAIKYTPSSLQGIPEHEDSMSCSQPALHASVEEQEQTTRHRRYGTVIKPLKAIFTSCRRRSRSSPGNE